MSSLARAVVVTIIGIWMLGTLAPNVSCVWQPCPSNGLSVDYDGIVTGVDAGSPAAQAALVPGDRIATPLPRDLFREPQQPLSFTLVHAGTARPVKLDPKMTNLGQSDALRLLALCASYLIFLIVGSGLLLLRPSAMTWSFYLYCVLRRYGDLWFYWPGSNAFFWFNVLALGTLGGASCALVTIFALRFPNNKLDGWRRPLNRIAVMFALLLPAAWLYAWVRIDFLGLPGQALIELLILVTSIVYLSAAAIFIVTLVQSRGEERQRMQWILIFPVILILHVVAINSPNSFPAWSSDALLAVAVCIPLTVAYAVVRRRVFDIEFVISRALVYGTITSIIAGTFLLLDWFLSKQFAETRFTLTAEIIVALAFGSALNMLHHNVDRFIDSTFFRQRHLAEQRLARAAGAVLHAESREAVDQFLVHEPARALDLASAALFNRDEGAERFVRRVAIGWNHADLQELTPEDPLVLHLLAEGAPVRMADVTWSSDELSRVANAVLAAPVLLRDQLVAIVLYGPHRTGADLDPDEVRSIVPLTERAGAAYDHIEARELRAQVASLTREREAKEREIGALRTEVDAARRRPAPGNPSSA
jgi:hypothetical protein